MNKTLQSFGKYWPGGLDITLFFFYKNTFYKNIEAEICEILRIF